MYPPTQAIMLSHFTHMHQIHSTTDPNIWNILSSPQCAGQDKRWWANQPGSDMNNLTSMLCKREQGLGPISKLFCTLMHLDLICLGLCLCLSVSFPSQTVILNQLAAEWGEWSSLQREVLGKTLLPGDNCPGSGHLHPLVRQQLLYSLCRNPFFLLDSSITDLIIDDDGQRRRSSSGGVTGTTCHKS